MAHDSLTIECNNRMTITRLWGVRMIGGVMDGWSDEQTDNPPCFTLPIASSIDGFVHRRAGRHGFLDGTRLRGARREWLTKPERETEDGC
jgi:hypothetical protein